MIEIFRPFIPSLLNFICMKHVELLTNVERAKLLHELLPGPIEDYLQYAKGLASYTQTHKTELAEKWGEQFYSFEGWLSLAMEVEKKIDQYFKKLKTSSRPFSDQLFDRELAFWSCDALLKYADQCTSARFKHLAKALFAGNKEQQPGPSEFLNRYTTLSVEAAAFIRRVVTDLKELVFEITGADQGQPQRKDYDSLPDYTQFRTGRHEQVAITALHVDGKDILLKGIFKGDAYPKTTTITLDELDNTSAIHLADYLLKRSAS